jgi:hypothetical protein
MIKKLEQTVKALTQAILHASKKHFSSSGEKLKGLMDSLRFDSEITSIINVKYSHKRP